MKGVWPAVTPTYEARERSPSLVPRLLLEFAAINVIALREGGLTSLALNCRFEQINDVVIIKH